MKWLVSVGFVHGQQEERAALLPAEQAHVGELVAQGVLETIHIGADRSRVWLVMSGESQDHVLQVLTALPLYPFMALDLAPLLEVAPGRNGDRAVASGQHGAVASGHGR